MNSYNSQYRDYYSSMVNKRKSSSNSNSHFIKNINIGKRLIQELTGVLIMLIFVIACKVVVTPKTQAVYNYSKKIVNKNYDYKQIVSKVKGFKYKEFEQKVLDYIDKVQNKIKGTKSIKEMTMKSFIMPCEGIITSEYGERTDPFTGEKEMHEGIDFEIDEKTPIKTVSNGTVKECGSDNELGNYIIIDHSLGIETKYAHLSKIDVKKGDIVNKGDIIGESGSTGKSTGPHLHFEIMYMGESKNPKEYLNIK